MQSFSLFQPEGFFMLSMHIRTAECIHIFCRIPNRPYTAIICIQAFAQLDQENDEIAAARPAAAAASSS